MAAPAGRGGTGSGSLGRRWPRRQPQRDTLGIPLEEPPMSSRTSIVFGSLAVTALASLFAFTRPAPVVGWEYTVVRGGIDLAASPKDQDSQIAGMNGTLNQLGGEGWELAAVQGQFAVFKRPR